jgi:hypothetical protein
MTVTQSEQLTDRVLSERLPGLTDSGADAHRLADMVFAELERVALSTSLLARLARCLPAGDFEYCQLD